MDLKKEYGQPEIFFKGNFTRTAGLIAQFEQLVLENLSDPLERTKIFEAAALSRRLHFPQDDRLEYGGDSYINHPLEVAARVIKQFGIYDSNIIIAALLHDSVEDQADLLASMVDEIPFDEALEKLALRAITEQHGAEVAQLVAALSNPDFDALVDRLALTGDEARKSKKRELYLEHVVDIFEHKPRASVIKMADLMQNALNLDQMPDGSKKDKLRAKYKPVLEYLAHALEIIPEQHILFSARIEILAAIRNGLSTQYSSNC